MKKIARLSTIITAASVLLLGGALPLRAASAEFSLPQVQPSAVTPGDTFTFDIAGFNSAGTTGYILGSAETATFGTPQTYTAAGVNGQDYTITSSETVNGTLTTDTFTVSTPTNFITTTTVNGTKITQLQFDLGDANSGSNTVDCLLPITANTQTGNILYGTSNTNFTLTPNVTLTNNGLSLAAMEGVSYGTTAISTLAVHSFTFTITYSTVPLVPEPSTLALGGLGLVACAGVILRRHRRA